METGNIKKSIAELIVQDKYPDALIECGKALKESPSDSEIISVIKFLFSRIQDAHYDFTPKSAEEYTLRGIARYYNEELEDALADYDKAITKDGTYDYAFKCRHLVNAALGKIDDAIQDIQTSIELNPTGEYFNDFGTLCGIIRKSKEAVAHYQKAVEISPNIPQFWYNFGCELMDQGQWKAAVQKFDKAIELWPKYDDALHNRKYILDKFPDLSGY